MAQNTISDELNRLIQAKAGIKSALEEKGLTIGDSSTLDEFPGLIQEMEVGGGTADTSQLIDLIECDIQQLIIPEGTTKMGGGAIYKQPNLQSITFPSTLTTIDKYAIGGYTLTKLELNIPSTIETIKDSAFMNSCIKTIIFNEDCSVNINQSGLSKISANTTGDPSINTMILRGKISSDDQGFAFNKITNLIIDTSALIDRSFTTNGLFKSNRINNLTILQGDTIYKKQFYSSRLANASIKILTNINNLGDSCFENENGYNPNEVIFKSTIPNTIGTGYVLPKGDCSIYVPGAYLADYQANSSLSTFSARFKPLAAINYDDTTYTVTASGRDNVELYVDASLCDSSTYTFDSTTQTGNHTVTVKSVDPSLGVLDEVSQEITI